MIEIRPATTKDLSDFYGRIPPVTVRAIVAIKDGEIQCVAGITLEKDISIAFSDMKPNAGNKFEVFRTAQKMIEWMRKFQPTVIKTPDSEDTSKFLKKLGFRFVAKRYNADIYRL